MENLACDWLGTDLETERLRGKLAKKLPADNCVSTELLLVVQGMAW